MATGLYSLFRRPHLTEDWNIGSVPDLCAVTYGSSPGATKLFIQFYFIFYFLLSSAFVGLFLATVIAEYGVS